MKNKMVDAAENIKKNFYICLKNENCKTENVIEKNLRGKILRQANGQTYNFIFKHYLIQNYYNKCKIFS